MVAPNTQTSWWIFLGANFPPLCPSLLEYPWWGLVGGWATIWKIGSSRENLQETVVFFLRPSLGILKYVDNNLILWKIWYFHHLGSFVFKWGQLVIICHHDISWLFPIFKPRILPGTPWFRSIWVNYNNSLTWIKAIWDDSPY